MMNEYILKQVNKDLFVCQHPSLKLSNEIADARVLTLHDANLVIAKYETLLDIALIIKPLSDYKS